MKDEFVRLPRELVARIARAGCWPNDAAALRAVLAEQHQGEPVTPRLKEPHYQPTPCRFGGNPGYYQVGDALVYDSLSEAQAAADKKNADLALRYHQALEHADPADPAEIKKHNAELLGEVDTLTGEVERLRAELVEWKERCQRNSDEAMSWMSKHDTLRAQLAERDALLREVRPSCHPKYHGKIDATLSASAEPSAPKCNCRNECEDCGDDGQTCTVCSGLERKP